MPAIETPQTEQLIRQSLIVFGLVLAVKILFFILDPTPSFSFDDSGAYLATAIIQYIPLDRSFVYGLLMKPMVRIQSLMPLVVAQMLLSAVSCAVVGFSLLRYFRLRLRLAVVFSVACAVEPLQLSMERFVMTETLATFGFACFLCAGFEYLRTHSLGWLAVCQVAGVFLVTIRVSYLPIVLLSTVLFPLFTVLRRHGWSDRSARRAGAAALLFSICFSQALLFGYRHWYGSLADKRPAYNYREGEFLLADFAPLVQPRDFPDPAVGEAIFSRVKYPLSNPESRSVQHWMNGGLVDGLKSVIADEDVANAVAKKAVEKAVLRDPLGAARLFAFTFREYFIPSYLHQEIRHEEYQINPPQPLSRKLIATVFGIETGKAPSSPSLTKRYAEATAQWSSFVITFPLLYALTLAIRYRRTQVEHIAMAVFSLLIVAGAGTVTEAANPRYITALAWMTCLMFGSVVTLWNRPAPG